MIRGPNDDFNRFFSQIGEVLKKHIIIKNIIIPQNLLMLSNDLINFQKTVLNKRSQENDCHINPFANLLFDDKWKSFPSSLLSTSQTKSKQSNHSTSNKSQILKWFKTLNSKQKSSAMAIRQKSFIYSFVKYSSSCYKDQQLNFRSGLTVPNIFINEKLQKIFETLIKQLSIVWTNEPILLLKLQENKESQKALIQWFDEVSNNKIFEYSHKVNNKQIPQDNCLWYNSNSFHSLSEILVNQIEKSIIKCYFNRDCSVYLKVQQIRNYMKKNNYSNQTLQTQFTKTITLSQIQMDAYLSEIKQIQAAFIQSERVNFIKTLQNLQKAENVPKKKKNKKRGKKKSHLSPVQKLSEQKNKKQQNLKKNHSDGQKQQQESEQNMIPESFDKDQIDQSKDIILVDQQSQKQDKSTGQFELCEVQTQILIDNENIVENISKQAENIFQQDYCNKSCQVQGRTIKSKNLVTNRDRRNSPTSKSNTLDNECSKSMLEGEFCSQTFTQAMTGECASKQQEFYDVFQEQTSHENGNCKRRRRRRANAHKNVQQMVKKTSSGLINKQLTNFIDSLSIQTNNLYESKVVCFERVRFFIKNIFPETQAILFGSNAVGLSLPSSDIDIMLHNIQCKSRQEINQILAQIAIQINAMGWIVSCSTYLSAKVPLVKLQIDPLISYFQTKRRCDYQNIYDPNMLYYLDVKQRKKAHNIKVDLTISLEEGMVSSSPSTQLMRSWLGDLPILQRITIAFKYILAEKGYNENFKGGIGSYCLFVMIAAYFKQFQNTLGQDQGQIFLDILKFYGQDFENKLKSITLKQEGSCFISLQESLNISELSEQIIISNPLRIIDPLSLKLMSSSCFQYNNVKAQFKRIRKDVLNVFDNIEKQVLTNYTPIQLGKILSSPKAVEKWINKFQGRTRFSIKKIIDGKQ